MVKLGTTTVIKDEDGEACLDLNEILKRTTTRVNTVHYYKFEKDGDSLMLTLYNKNKRKINVKEKK